MKNDKDQDAELSWLFEDAKDKLGKISQEAEKKKKEIVIQLAKSLEGKIDTNTICMKIVKRLEGLVSDSLIHECLPEKYKQEYRIKNAKKQKKKHNKEINLAPLPVLNMKEYPEVEEEAKEGQKNKEVILVGVDGKEYHKREDNGESSKTSIEDDSDTVMTDKTCTPSSYSPQLEQEHRSEEHEDHFDSEPEDPSFNDIDESGDLEKAIEKSNQLTATVAGVSSTYTHDNNKDVLYFEFSMFYRDIQKYMAASFKRLGNNGKVWFSGRIDKRTGVVIAPNLGRLDQQQQGEL